MERVTGIKIHNGLSFGYIHVYEPQKEQLNYSESQKPLIIASENLTPGETVRFGKISVKALVVTNATSTSHTAILSRTMDWPAITGVKINPKWHNKMAIVDGYNGVVIIEPDEATLRCYQIKQVEEEQKKQQLLNAYKNKRSVTNSGKELKLYANISTPSDIHKVIANDAEGIGNFKTEFMYLDSLDYPTEEELFRAYKKIVTQMGDKRVVIRTFDIGTDKIADYFGLDKEENPALGYRAIRIGLDRPEVFETQLRAIIRASAFGKVSLMYPMIVSVDEVLKIKKLVRKNMDELKKEGIPFDENMEQGIMIETPAAAIISDKLAEMVDFFSIGTNDLTQYTLAIDRQNEKLDEFYNPHHEAILRMIQMVVDNAHKCGKWAGICGELGADATLTEQFVRMGLDELSVAPSMVLKLRKIVREMKVEE